MVVIAEVSAWALSSSMVNMLSPGTSSFANEALVSFQGVGVAGAAITLFLL